MQTETSFDFLRAAPVCIDWNEFVDIGILRVTHHPRSASTYPRPWVVCWVHCSPSIGSQCGPYCLLSRPIGRCVRIWHRRNETSARCNPWSPDPPPAGENACTSAGQAISVCTHDWYWWIEGNGCSCLVQMRTMIPLIDELQKFAWMSDKCTLIGFRLKHLVRSPNSERYHGCNMIVSSLNFSLKQAACFN